MRRFPLVGGIDVAGSVVSSGDGRFREGEAVLVTGHDLGVGVDGGYAGYVRVPGDWVVRVPAPFDRVRRHGRRHCRVHGGPLSASRWNGTACGRSPGRLS